MHGTPLGGRSSLLCLDEPSHRLPGRSIIGSLPGQRVGKADLLVRDVLVGGRSPSTGPDSGLLVAIAGRAILSEL